MKNLSASLFFVFLTLSACSTTPQLEPPEYFAKLSRGDAEAQLSQVQDDLEEIDKEIRGAEVRRDSAQMKQGTDATQDGAVEGTEADLASLQNKKGVLINKQLMLERRLRDLNDPAL